MKKILYLFVLVIFSFPISVVFAILESPLANRLEQVTGIESVGHSGPADWVYYINFAVIILVGSIIIFLRKSKSP